MVDINLSQVFKTTAAAILLKFRSLDIFNLIMNEEKIYEIVLQNYEKTAEINS